MGLFLPTLFVHAVDEKPHDAHKRPDNAGANDIGLQAECEWLVQVDQPTQTSNCRQHSQHSRQERGPEHKVALHERVASEEHHGDRLGRVIHAEKEERQRLQLFRIKDAQVARAPQHEQWREEEEATQRLDGATDEAECGGKDGCASAHRLEQIVEEHGHRDGPRRTSRRRRDCAGFRRGVTRCPSL